MNYYLQDENGKITQFSKIKFNENCLETEEEIITVSGGLNGDISMLKSDYDVHIETQEYQDKVEQNQKELLKSTLQAQIDEIDKKSIRALREPSVKDEETGQTWAEYYAALAAPIRAALAELL